MPRTAQPTLAEDASDRDRMLKEHLPLVHFVARQVNRTLSGNVDIDDLVNAGTVGLINAVTSFDTKRGLAFSTYAAPRIRGAILDDLRKWDHVPRTLRRKQRILGRAQASLQAQLQREPTDAELAESMGVDLGIVWRWKAETEEAVQLSLDRPLTPENAEGTAADVLPGETGLRIEDSINRAEEVAIMREYISELSEREQIVLTLYYFEGLKLHEIAKVLELTESRVSQIRTKTLATLRGRMAHLRSGAA